MPSLRRSAHTRAPCGQWNGARLAAPAGVLVLVLALLWAQTLGLWHAVVHDNGQSLTQRHAVVEQTDNAKVAQGTGFFEVVFGNHHAGADCRLFDQLSHGDALGSVATLAFSLAAPAAPVVHVSGLAVVRWLALFQARAPPSAR